MNIEKPSNRRESAAWCLALLWVVFIYVTIPLARKIQEFIRDQGSPAVFFWITVSFFCGAALWVVVAVCRKKILLSPARMSILAFILALFLWLTWVLRRNPEEAIHFVQYGALTMLVFRAFRFRVRDSSIYFATAMVCCMFGILDEIIQWITPRRYFDYRDIGLNVLAVTLITLSIITIKPLGVIRVPWSARGARAGFIFLAINTVLMTFCLMNTTSLKIWYTSFIPAANKVPYVTAEYGYGYNDPDIGTFKSRMSPKEMASEDKLKAEEIAPVLRAVRTDEQYREFTRTTSPILNPLLYEARVRLFRRDRYATTARHTGDENERKRTAIIAFRENQILERYMPNVLEASGYKWRDDIRDYFVPFMENAPPYKSPVGQILITKFSQRSMFMLSMVVLLAAIIGERWAARKLK